MLVALPATGRDIHLAFDLLKWIAELGDDLSSHKILIASSASVERGDVTEMDALAKGCGFGMVRSIHQREQQSGVGVVNSLFRAASTSGQDMGRYFLWLETNSAPIGARWLDILEEEYIRSRKPFMGNIVQTPFRHMYPCGIYPAQLARYAPALLCANEKSFWSIQPEVVVRNCHNTPRIAFELKATDSAVLICGIDRSSVHVNHEPTQRREDDPIEPPKTDDGITIIQLGRTGDIINLFPVCKDIFDSSGEKPSIVVRKDYLPLFDRIGYATPIAFDGTLEQCQEAIAMAKSIGKENIVNCMFFGNSTNKVRGENFLKAQWEVLGYGERWGQLPLVFDRRNYTAEQEMKRRLGVTRGYVLTSFDGNSSPPTSAQRKVLSDLVKSTCNNKAQIVDISSFKSENFADMLGVLGDASLLVSADSAPIHLNRATGTPCIHFGRSGWSNSGMVENVRYCCQWAELEKNKQTVVGHINSVIEKKTKRGKQSNLSIVCYLPPPGVGNTEAFLSNIEDNPPSNKIHFISDYSGYKPDTFLRKQIVKGANSHATSIPIFGAVVDAANEIGAEYFMVLEPDCRVFGDGWDVRLLDESESYCKDFLVSGTPVAFNIQFASQGVRAACNILIREYNRETGTNIYPLKDEWVKRNEWAFFSNGAFSIYKTKPVVEAWKRKTFIDKPWDMRVGLELQRMFGVEYIERFALMTQALSFNGEAFTTREYQKKQLKSGVVAGIHNIKDAWVP